MNDFIEYFINYLSCESNKKINDILNANEYEYIYFKIYDDGHTDIIGINNINEIEFFNNKSFFLTIDDYLNIIRNNKTRIEYQA